MTKKLSVFALSMLAGISAASAEECKTIKISGHPQFPPLLWEDGKSMAGSGIEIAKKIFADLNVSVEVISRGAYQRTLDEFKAGSIDLVPGMYYFKDRAEYAHYVAPSIATDATHAWVTKGAKSISSQADLQGLRGMKIRGFGLGSDFESYAASSLKISDSDSVETAFKMLSGGRVDYFLVSDFSGRSGLASSAIDEATVSRTNLTVNTAEVHLAFSKKSPCIGLAPKVAERVQSMIDSGEMAKMIEEGHAAWRAKVKS